MNLYWLEQTEPDVPPNNDWLSPHEVTCLARLRFPKRRSDWRLGRWTAKQALASCLNHPTNLLALASLEIRAASSGAPEAFLHAQPAGLAISLSHRAGTALCTVGPDSCNFGCDLELVEPRSPAFVDDYFTPNEKVLIEGTPPPDHPLLLALLWSAKESALKSKHVGLRFDTRSVSVSPVNPVLPHALGSTLWSPLCVEHSGIQTLTGWWRLESDLVRTAVSEAPLRAPIPVRDQFSARDSRSQRNVTAIPAPSRS